MNSKKFLKILLNTNKNETLESLSESFQFLKSKTRCQIVGSILLTDEKVLDDLLQNL